MSEQDDYADKDQLRALLLWRRVLVAIGLAIGLAAILAYYFYTPMIYSD